MSRSVHSRHRLIQKDYFGLTRQGPGDKYSLLLTAGEISDDPVFELIHFHLSERFVDYLFVFSGKRPKKTGFPIPSHRYHLEHGCRKVHVEVDHLLWYISDLGSVLKIMDLLSEHLYCSGRRLQKSQHDFYQSCFAAAIWTNHSQIIPFVNIQVHFRENQVSAIGKRHSVNLNNIFCMVYRHSSAIRKFSKFSSIIDR
ncbi:MAG: hypothetical protein ACD_61C00162G0003 [uncultured bacterium]|nr:MAG: hypothetical protein ACD_61C00162G0003 [uncultured bacterium]